MTHRGGKEALEKRSGIGENERQPEIAQLAAWWRRSKLVILVMLRKGNHPGKVYVRRGQRKALYRTKRDSLEGPHEEAELQHKTLTRGKNLAFSEDTCLQKERVRLKVIPRKVGVGLKWRQEPSRRRLGRRLAWWRSTEKEASHLLGLRKTPVLRPGLQSKQSSLCGLHHSGGGGGGGPNGQIMNVKRAADGRRQRSWKIVDEEKKVQSQERILVKHLHGLERSNFCDFDKPCKRAYRREKIESNEQSKEGGQSK